MKIKMHFDPQNVQSYHMYNPFSKKGTKFRMLLSALDPKPNCIVLDVGCGVGNFDFPLSHAVKEIVGIDISRDALSVANKYRHLFKQKNVHFIAADLLSLPFKNRKFDRAFIIDVLEHIPSMPLSSLRDVRRALRPRGVLFVYTATYSKFSLHYLESLLMGFRGRLWYADDEPKHVNRFRPVELVEVVSVGFKLKDMRFFGHVFEYFASILNRLARHYMRRQGAGARCYDSTSNINILYGLFAKIEQIDLALFGSYPSAGAFITFVRT